MARFVLEQRPQEERRRRSRAPRAGQLFLSLYSFVGSSESRCAAEEGGRFYYYYYSFFDSVRRQRVRGRVAQAEASHSHSIGEAQSAEMSKKQKKT